jgi:protein-S-isoprenylcysteine O-methyltransferase Ste14
MTPETITAISSTILLLSIVTVIIQLKLRGYNALSGTPPIPMGALLIGELSMVVPVFAMLGRALGWQPGPPVALEFRWLAVALMLMGSGIAIPSMLHLGEELRFGLSSEPSAELKSRGLYRLSRNPLYLGFYLIVMAACLYVPAWPILFFAALAIVIHHRIVLAEERFLRQRFGETYIHYTRQVRRYL